MGLARLSLHLQHPRSERSSKMAAQDVTSTSNTGGGHADGRLSTSGDSAGAAAAAVPLSSPKRPSRFRLSSLKQLGAATRSEIRANVRNDWDWPLPKGEDGVPLSLISRVGAETEYVEREPGSDETDDDDDDGFVYARPKDTSLLLNGGFSRRRLSSVNDYSLSANGGLASPEYEALARKERRRRRLREELEWNEGLQTFEARRNAWTGAILRPSKHVDPVDKAAAANGTNGHSACNGHHDDTDDTATTGEAAHIINGSSQPESATQPSANGHSESAAPAGPGPGPSPSTDKAPEHTNQSIPTSPTTTTTTSTNGMTNTTTTTTTTATTTSTTAPSTASTSTPQPASTTSQRSSLTAVSRSPPSRSHSHSYEPFIPLSPPLISPSHPVRREITPSTYPQIYSRVVVQGTTPNLPINLSHMTAALVAGWKADDQWPPKQAGPLDPLVGRRRRKKAGDAGGAGGGAGTGEGKAEKGIVKGLKKVLRITTGHGHHHGNGHGRSLSGSIGAGAGNGNGNGQEKAPTNGAALLDA